MQQPCFVPPLIGYLYSVHILLIQNNEKKVQEVFQNFLPMQCSTKSHKRSHKIDTLPKCIHIQSLFGKTYAILGKSDLDISQKVMAFVMKERWGSF